MKKSTSCFVFFMGYVGLFVPPAYGAFNERYQILTIDHIATLSSCLNALSDGDLVVLDLDETIYTPGDQGRLELVEGEETKTFIERLKKRGCQIMVITARRPQESKATFNQIAASTYK
ncbi:MAG: hypothetical protein WCT20_05600, partial [Candidatus Babeliales bacterium]